MIRRACGPWRDVVVLTVLALAVAWAAPARGVTFPDKPPHKHFYVDEAGLIGEAEGKAIDEVSGALLREQRVGIVVVTIKSLLSHDAAAYTIERYARELFDHWGVGSKERDYGILILLSRQDRRARIELGSAWGHVYDAQAQQIMDTLMIPEFRQGRYAEGLLAGVRGADAMMRGLNLPKPKQPWWVLPLFFAFLAGSVAVIVSLFKSGRKGWGWALLIGLGMILFFMLRAAAQSGGSGGAFGGGSSGGGGASGSW